MKFCTSGNFPLYIVLNIHIYNVYYNSEGMLMTARNRELEGQNRNKHAIMVLKLLFMQGMLNMMYYLRLFALPTADSGFWLECASFHAEIQRVSHFLHTLHGKRLEI